MTCNYPVLTYDALKAAIVFSSRSYLRNSFFHMQVPWLRPNNWIYRSGGSLFPNQFLKLCCDYRYFIELMRIHILEKEYNRADS